jgi:HEAT repeat protein
LLERTLIAPGPVMRRIVMSLALLLLAGAAPVLLWDTAWRAAVRRDAAALAQPDGPERRRATSELRAWGAAAVPELVCVFEVPGSAAAAGARGGGTSRDAGPLTLPVMDLLRQQAGPAVIAELAGALDDSDGDVRHFSGLTLAWIGAEAVPPLIEVLEQAPDAHRRTSAAWILSLMGAAGTPALPALQAALQDPDQDVRFTARYAIGQLSAGNEAFWNLVQTARETPR